jgi:thiamine-phosphate pyrophosphorylase
MKPLLCLVTSRQQLARAVGRPTADARTLLLQQIQGAVAAGVDLVQIRERDLGAGELRRLVAEAVEIAAGSHTRVVVNDRVDVALAAGAAGVHLRDAGLRAVDVRRLAPHLLVGRSVHSVEATNRAGPVDYLIAGTVFATSSKPVDSTLIGIDGLAAIVRAASGTPVLAIGGMTAAVASQVMATGAAGLAAIAALVPDEGVEDLVAAVEKNVHTLRFAFDTGSAVP